MARSSRRRKVRWFAGSLILAVAALASWVSLKPEPWREYVPWCGSLNEPTYIKGPIRERFLLLMDKAFDEYRVERLVRDGRMFVRKNETYDHRWSIEEIELNYQHRMVQNIASGVTIDDVFFPPPPALTAELRATEQFFGPFPRRNERGERIYETDRRFESCGLMRAAILKDP